MKLSKPKEITWWIAVVVGVLGILAMLLPIPTLQKYSFWMVSVGFVLLALATLLKGL